MAMTDETGGMNTTMLVSPTNNSDGFGGDGWWILLLFILMGGNGWNNGYGANEIYPWMNQADITNTGFRDQMLNTNIMGIQGALSDMSTQLCGGFAGINANINNGFAQNEISNNARQMANMQQAFANQYAMSQGFNDLQSQLANCCCANQLATNELKYIAATENCADRAALSDGIRDIIANQTAGVQKILDVMCQDKIDAKNEKIADLERQLAMADLAASQTAQTAYLLSNINTTTSGTATG